MRVKAASISTNILCSNYIFTYLIQHYIYRVNDMSLEGFRNEQMILQVILCFQAKIKAISYKIK